MKRELNAPVDLGDIFGECERTPAAPAETEEPYTDEYISIDDIAAENGFWIDDDGHWQELDEEW